MRATALTAVAFGTLLMASSVEAQVSCDYGYGINSAYGGGLLGGSYGYGGVYPGQAYSGIGGYGGYAAGGYFGGPYVGAALGPSYGLANGGLTYLPQTLVNNNPYYRGYTYFAQYGVRRAGGGRMFGTYVPREYRVYQPRPGGLFDR